MSNWKIDEQAAGRIVLSAAKMAKQYSVSAAKLDSKAKQMVEALPHSEFVSAVVEGWAQNCGAPGVLSVKGSTDVAIKGVSGAIAAYHEGNLEMAGNAQMTASAADFPKELPKADGTPNPVPPGDE